MSNAVQVRARRKAKDEMAQALGYTSFADMCLAADKGYIKFPTCPPQWAAFRDATNPSRLPRKREE